MTLPIDVWGIERADGSLRGYQDGSPLTWAGRETPFARCRPGERPVPLRIVRADDAPSATLRDVCYATFGGTTLRCSLFKGHTGQHRAHYAHDPAQKCLQSWSEPEPAPAPVTRAEFEALRECVFDVAKIAHDMTMDDRTDVAMGHVIDRLAALRKEPTDGN